MLFIDELLLGGHHINKAQKSLHRFPNGFPTRKITTTLQQDQEIVKLLDVLISQVNGHFRNLNWRYLPYVRPM
jgi:hypothetical protein